MPYSEAVRPTRLEDSVSTIQTGEYVFYSYSAISPRLAMSTEVSGLTVGATVELRRTALTLSSWRERWVDFRMARILD
jgi:hypothetical protein